LGPDYPSLDVYTPYTITQNHTDLFEFDPIYDSCGLDIAVKFVYKYASNETEEEAVYLSSGNATQITDGFITTTSDD